MSDASQNKPVAYVVNCPACGGSLRLEGMRELVYCPSCGNAIRLSFSQPAHSPLSDSTVRDASSGYGLFSLKAPQQWQVTGSSLRRTSSSSRPYVARAELQDETGGSIVLQIGDAGTRNSAGMNALMAMYGGHLAGIDHINYADVPDPLILADVNASSVATSIGASNMRFCQQLASPDLASEQAKAFERFSRIARISGGAVSSPLAGIVLRIYELTCGGQPWKMASFVRIEATKEGLGLGEGVSGAMSNLAGSIGDMIGGTFGSMGSLFSGQLGGQQSPGQQSSGSGSAMDFFMQGGLIGKMRRDRQAAQAQQAQTNQQQAAQLAPQATPQQQPTLAQAQQALSQGVAWCMPDFAQYVSSGTIFWSIPVMATFVAPQPSFDTQLKSMFLPLVSSLEIHPDVEMLAMQVVQQETAQVQAATQGQLAHNQAMFQAQQAAHRQQQAAFDSYNAAWQARSDAHHQQFRASTNAQFNTGASSSAPDFSEAIRGVNTYTTSDGREVEVSVRADRAYENQAGDVIGTSGGFEPGADWTEIPRT